MNSDLYKNAGVLFYAIVKVDSSVAPEGHRNLNEISKRSRLYINPKLKVVTTLEFNECYLNTLESSKCFDDYITFHKKYPNEFSKE